MRGNSPGRDHWEGSMPRTAQAQVGWCPEKRKRTTTLGVAEVWVEKFKARPAVIQIYRGPVELRTIWVFIPTAAGKH